MPKSAFSEKQNKGTRKTKETRETGSFDRLHAGSQTDPSSVSFYSSLLNTRDFGCGIRGQKSSTETHFIEGTIPREGRGRHDRLYPVDDTARVMKFPHFGGYGPVGGVHQLNINQTSIKHHSTEKVLWIGVIRESVFGSR